MSLAQTMGNLLAIARDACSPLWKIECRLKGIACQPGVTFVGRPIVSCHPESILILESGVRIVSAQRGNPLACFQPCVLRTLAAGAVLRLGKDVGISGTVICAGNRIEIGEGAIIGSGAVLLDNDFHQPEGDSGWRTDHTTNAAPIRIGKGVFIGARAIILKGVTIGDRAVIGAGAVVTHDVPAGALAAGNPARITAR
ncbi:MAG: acyltransferase [Verrucomicrobiota bacterium]